MSKVLPREGTTIKKALLLVAVSLISKQGLQMFPSIVLYKCCGNRVISSDLGNTGVGGWEGEELQ